MKGTVPPRTALKPRPPAAVVRTGGAGKIRRRGGARTGEHAAEMELPLTIDANVASPRAMGRWVRGFVLLVLVHFRSTLPVPLLA